jgi:hypothetical protein
MRSLLYVGMLAGSCFFTACTERPRDAAAATPPAAGVIDSALPMDVLLARFRRDVPEVKNLRSNVASRDELVRRVIAAMGVGDTASLERVAVSLSEYAWLYFPTATVAKPPYEVPPALAWFQVQEKNRRGALRALRELGGHRVELQSYHCDASPTIEDQNRLWTGCAVTLSRDGATPVTIRLFGAILERAGRFEVLSYENDF